MRELTSRKWMTFKAVFFLFLGLLTSTLLLLEVPTARVALLLALAIWAFCRSYYFAFYAIEHYVDREYRFSGLISFVRYYFREKR